MQKNILAYIALLLFYGNCINAQEVVTGLSRNIYLQANKSLSESTKSTQSADTLELPFFDDFSDSYIYPDSKRWKDKFAFINNTYSVKQISAGVATLDALDSDGRLYETASSFVFEADHLTSKPINLNYNSDDNIYLSFFYEAGGLSDKPEPGDSLVLQFWAPAEQEWFRIWKAPLNETNGFKPVIINIADSRFLKKGFRFRFINHASLSSAVSDPSMAGNSDIWNIDYILLDKNRHPADTIPPDVAFTLPVRSVLKTYEEMPWNQFRQVFLSEMGPYITINYRNNDRIVRNVTRSFQITDVYNNSVVHSFTAGATNIDSGAVVTYNAGLIYTFNSSSTDSALFRIKCYLTTDAFDRKQNDTIVYYQRFGRCFAYDDGTSEGGYGISGLGSRNAMLAYRFKSFVPDTLRAVQICFNDSYQNANQRAFDLMVWDNNKGIPGNVIYTQEDMVVKQGESINGFYTYVLDKPVEIIGDFFVGWRQRSETFLNAGFDLNTPHNGRQLYYLNGEWNVSQMSGSVMIRPVFGPEIKSSDINNPLYNEMRIKIWPNPASEYIYIGIGNQPLVSDIGITIIDLAGRIILKSNYYNSDRLDISALPAGIYFVSASAKSKILGTTRLIISR
ncbi:MAG TPA: T9SS type A sorting domain-containing protein [Bacteroidales bacterium]|nr:T9SS type A sorting domain-containing protein [Bacteroidales bacterium]HOK74130.1 T9SS type A sorting domain-containing protein [Bacteroidales bacterium]HOU29756.1 T9SS type A sorting domain-containing protein [Bacteroidales bacterium]HPP92540.1 T9SS type A sorting domain-containing protein [Bacteroidales bacterium]HQG56818.1 T9SS type A sorting domain-containing protein [Bacteroidales bacterium]